MTSQPPEGLAAADVDAAEALQRAQTRPTDPEPVDTPLVDDLLDENHPPPA